VGECNIGKKNRRGISFVLRYLSLNAGFVKKGEGLTVEEG